ncbi:hypothetical protein GBO14_09045 [Pseudoalteromonas shioyasakiensis]|uniref:hypothetical protein n=1 Tax=Pseudoalteromonas shioyasakiensis TaxID=1190813 RepID=UPI002096396F|nr:hypothetical protein [Pseudoalteromonas shioyasakiensis]MCO6354862.1 hypothetical protein [Pseudoalteromonas shioyasakiensis]
MNSSTQMRLNAVPSYDENYVVTTHPDEAPLSRVFDLLWDFSGQEKMRVNRSSVISFKGVDEAYRADIQSTLAFLSKVHKEIDGELASLSQVTGWKLGLSHIMLVNKNADWASFSDERLYKKFKVKLKKHIQESKLGETAASAIITVLNLLNKSGLCVIKVNGLEITGWVVKEGKQHIAIPIGMYQRIIASALETVETYHPYRHIISDTQAELEQIHREENERGGATLPVRTLNNRINRRIMMLSHGIPNFRLTRGGSELGRLQVSCAIVCLAFSGVRIGELASMNKDSYKEIGGNKIPTLRGEETKRNGQVIQETWQTSEVAKDALELAHDMTQFLRDTYEEKNNDDLRDELVSAQVHAHRVRQITSAFLGLKPSAVKSQYCVKNMSKKFNSFIQSSGILATQADVEEFNRLNPSRDGQLKVDGTLPKFSAHDFRRSFAVFFKRYGFGTAASIKFQYKHRNIQMSDYYANNASLQAMEDVLMDHNLLELMSEEGIQMGVDIFDDIYNESETLSGAGGERVARDKFEKLQDGYKVYMSRDEIESLVRNGTLSVVKLPTGGYCMNGTCSRVCGIGQFAGEIKPCEHQVVTDKEAKVILRQNKRLIQSFRDMNIGAPMMNSILIGMKQKILRNEVTIKKHNLKYEEFNDAVKGVIAVQEA